MKMDELACQKAHERARRRGCWDISNPDERYIYYEMRYPTLKTLKRGEVVDLDGIKLKMDEGEIQPGDLYVGERNTGPHLLTAREVNREFGCIFPTCDAYPYDINECVKVREA